MVWRPEVFAVTDSTPRTLAFLFAMMIMAVVNCVAGLTPILHLAEPALLAWSALDLIWRFGFTAFAGIGPDLSGRICPCVVSGPL
jgi:hypothetical protein